MRQIDLRCAMDLYGPTLREGALPEALSSRLLQACDALGARRVAVFGSVTGSGGVFAAALGGRLSVMVNSDTLCPGQAAPFDAVVLATHPKHYPAALAALERAFPGSAIPVILVFAREEERTGQAGQGQRGKRVRPCHYQDLFVRHDGDVYPCCLTKDDPRLRIGNIRDGDLAERLVGYDLGACSCPEWAYDSVFRKAGPGDRVDIAMLNVELSLFCNSACAMCCVHSPQYTRDFKKPDASTHEGILRMFEEFQPRGAYFQGGEVLAQPEAFRLLEAVRKASPDTALSLVTNGNVPMRAIERAQDLFDSFCISFYGFQPHTYKAVTGLDIARARRSAEHLCARDPKKVCLKYLSTAISFHEAPLFLDWALDVKPGSVMLVDADTQDYIKYAAPPRSFRFGEPQPPLHDLYWDRILSRTRGRIDAVLESRGEYIRENDISVTLCGGLFSRK